MGNHLFRINMTNYQILLIFVLMSFPKYKYQEEPEHSAHPINIYLNI